MRKHAAIVLAAGTLCAGGTARAQEGEPPDLAFLEYLGSWQASDEEWLEIAEWEKDNPPREAEPEEDAREERRRKRTDDEEGT